MFSVFIMVGCSKSSPPDIVQGGTPPVAKFGVSTVNGVVGEIIAFTDQSTDLDNDIVSWSWSFADGSATVVSQNCTYSFAKAGSYLVTLVVKDKKNLTSNFSIRILIKNTITPDYSSLGRSIQDLIPLLYPKAVVCAHRGYHEDFPENSLPSISAAAQAGIKVVEIDARLTVDNEVAIMHDATTARTSNGNLIVAQRLMRDLKQLRLLHKGKVTTYEIPTLKECLEVAKGKVYLNIDASWDITVDYYNKIYNEVAALNMVGMVFFYTENVSVARGLMEFDKDVIVLLGAGNSTDWLNANNLNPKAKLWHLATATLSNNFTYQPHVEGIRFFANAYVNSTTSPTPNQDIVTDNLLNNRVSIIQTDYPVEIKNYLQSKNLLLQ